MMSGVGTGWPETGGVRVVLSAEDRDAAASNVECLM